MTLGEALVIRGDARCLPLPDASVDLVCVSPPYFALRDYGYDGQIGSETTWQEWLANLLDCTREWMRALKPEGSIFVDLGDKYATAAGPKTGKRSEALQSNKHGHGGGKKWVTTPRGSRAEGVPDKSLMLLPERYRIACVDELGLIARAVIVWDKPNGLPESVTDRVRRSHEDWVHLVRQPRYYAAVDEIREPHSENTSWKQRGRYRTEYGDGSRIYDGGHASGLRTTQNPLGKLPGSVWSVPSEPLNVPPELGVDHFAAFPSEWPKRIIQGWSPPGICTECGTGRRPVVDKRTTKIGTLNSYANQMAATSATAISGGANRTTSAVQDVTIIGYACACTPYTDHEGTGGSSGDHYSDTPGEGIRAGGYPRTGYSTVLQARPKVGPWREYHFDDWTPPPTRPAVILDPMGGTGTTALAAKALGRIGMSVDLSADYARLAAWRTSDRGELARVLGVAKPPKPIDGQLTFGGDAA